MPQGGGGHLAQGHLAWELHNAASPIALMCVLCGDPTLLHMHVSDLLLFKC